MGWGLEVSFRWVDVFRWVARHSEGVPLGCEPASNQGVTLVTLARVARPLENGVTKWLSQISLVSRAQRHNTASRETHCSNQRTLEISEVSDNLWILRAAIGRL
jgi:hypothetical protein